LPPRAAGNAPRSVPASTLCAHSELLTLEVERLGTFNVVLTDFERTLVRLFEDSRVEQDFFTEVWIACAKRDVPVRTLYSVHDSPYSLWTKAHRWLKRRDPVRAERLYHAVTKIATRYELDVAPSVRLFDDVVPVLDRLKAMSIPVLIVSNNATEAVERVLRQNCADGLVSDVVGRHLQLELKFRYGNLKPKPHLLREALTRSGRAANTALIVGDSVDDMKAGRAADISLRVGLLQHSTSSSRQLRRAGATHLLSRFGDLLQLVAGGDRLAVR
jgi:phosphoglycolate phosphatase-like HAD superfamily hydrolase